MMKGAVSRAELNGLSVGEVLNSQLKGQKTLVLLKFLKVNIALNRNQIRVLIMKINQKALNNSPARRVIQILSFQDAKVELFFPGFFSHYDWGY